MDLKKRVSQPVRIKVPSSIVLALWGPILSCLGCPFVLLGCGEGPVYSLVMLYDLEVWSMVDYLHFLIDMQHELSCLLIFDWDVLWFLCSYSEWKKLLLPLKECHIFEHYPDFFFLFNNSGLFSKVSYSCFLVLNIRCLVLHQKSSVVVWIFNTFFQLPVTSVQNGPDTLRK